jgi:hypothetical protein
MEQASRGFRLSPFDPAVKPTAGSVVGAASDFAALEFDFSRCPSQRGDRSAGAPEFAAIGPRSVAAFHYVALSATHLDCILGDPNAPDYMPPNGVIVPGRKLLLPGRSSMGHQGR